MAIVIIPKELSKNQDLIAVPKSVYEEFLAWQGEFGPVQTFKPTKEDLKILAKARKNFKEGKFIKWNELKNELDDHHRRKSRKTT